MNLNDIQINLNQFYITGKICFLVIACANTYTLIHNWGFLGAGGKLSSIFGIIFNIALVLFFNYLHNQQKRMEKAQLEAKIPNDEQLKDFMDELK